MKFHGILTATVLTAMSVGLGLLAAGIKPGNPCKEIEPSWDFSIVAAMIVHYYDLFIASALATWLVYWLIVRNHDWKKPE